MWIKDFINGLIYGVAQVVPGVSGATIAVIAGFYDQLIETANHFTEDYRKYLRFLIPFGLGTVGGIIAFSSIIHFLLTNFSFPTMAFFIGLIAGIIPIIYSKIKEDNKLGVRELTLIVIPIVILVIIPHISSDAVIDPATAIANMEISFMFFLFVIGFVTALSLVVPGFSGSFILLLAGVYHLATYSVYSIRLWVEDMGNFALILDIIKVMGPMTLGLVVGALVMARFIERLIERHFVTVYSIVLGLLIGSVYALFMEPIVFQSGVSGPIIFMGIASFALGGMCSYLSGRQRL